MAILQSDVRLFASDKMDDTDAGGGDITQIQIISGVPNTIFDPIPPLARAFGNLSIRKVFSSVFTQNVDRYFGAHSIITRNPKDETVNVTLFDSGDHHDRRAEVASRVEAFRTQSLVYPGTLLGTQFIHSKTIKLFQTVGTPPPPIGTVFVLASVSNTNVQYIKVLLITITTETFTVGGKTFEKDIMVLELSQPLKYDFIGAAAVTEDTAANSDASMYTSEASDSAKYYGSRPIEDPIVVGQSFVKCDTIFSQLIPATLAQTALLDVGLTGTSFSGYDSDSDTITATYAATWTPNTEIKLPSPFRSGTLNITGVGTLTDVSGNLVLGATVIGTANYAAGTLLLSATAPSLEGVKTVTITPQPRLSSLSDAVSIPITDVNRGLVYTENVGDTIAVGAVRVSVLILGTWYDMNDDGAGALVSTNGIGTGEIVYETGSISIQLTALPDVGGEIIIYFTGASSIANVSSSPVLPLLDPIRDTIENQIDNVFPIKIKSSPNLGIDPASVTIVSDSGVAISGSADGSLSGTGYAGSVSALERYGNDRIISALTHDYTSTIRLSGTNDGFTATYDTHNTAKVEFTETELDALYVGNIVTAQIDPAKSMFKGSVFIKFIVDAHEFMSTTTIERSNTARVRIVVLTDDGNGKLLVDGVTLANSSVNYTTSTVTFDITEIAIVVPAITIVIQYYLNSPSREVLNRTSVSVNLTKASTLLPSVNTSSLLASCVVNDLVESAFVQTVAAASQASIVVTPPETQDMPVEISSVVLPATIQESVVIEVDGDVLRIGTDNSVFSVVNGIESNVGTYNPSTGIATISQPDIVNQVLGFSGGVTLSSTSVFVGQGLNTHLSTESKVLVFRIPEVPIQTASFSMRVETSNGTVFTAVSDVNGDVTGTGVTGTINFTTGVGHLTFDDWIVRETFQYNAVAESFLSLDPKILRIDAVRLPSNGKVRIFDTGDIIVVFNEATQNGTFLSNTQTDLGRVALSEIRIIDSSGVPVDSEFFAIDLELGLIDWGDLSTVNQPLDIFNVIEDIAVLKEFEINGKLTFVEPLTHDYPVAGTLVGSAIGHGDLFATASEPFDQKTWTNEWSDAVIGSSVSAEFNTSIHPIVMSNASTINERWALIFSNSSSVNVVGETVGQVATNVPITADIAPINPATGFPYFTIAHESFGAGWASGNVVRFDSIAANVPIWCVQSVIQGEPTNTDSDALTWCLSTRGGVESL